MTDWLPHPPLIAFLIPGIKELILVALVALALYGRSGSRILRATPYGRSIAPWLNLVRTRPRPRAQARVRATSERRGRGFWALALIVAAAAAAWVATRVVIHGASHGPLR